jgi:hypothetical protein
MAPNLILWVDHDLPLLIGKQRTSEVATDKDLYISSSYPDVEEEVPSRFKVRQLAYFKVYSTVAFGIVSGTVKVRGA